jgi:ribosomal protein L37AE/L43A
MTPEIEGAARHGARLPLPANEAEALATVAAHLADFTCPACGRSWITGRTTFQLWHSCPVARRKRTRSRKWTPPPVKDTLEDARSALWAGFRDALPGEALLRQIDEAGEEG